MAEQVQPVAGGEAQVPPTVGGKAAAVAPLETTKLKSSSTNEDITYALLAVDSSVGVVQGFMDISTINDQMKINEQLYKTELQGIKKNAELQNYLLTSKHTIMAQDFLAAAVANGVQGESVSQITQSLALQGDFNINNLDEQTKAEIERVNLKQRELRKEAEARKTTARVNIATGLLKDAVLALLLL